MDLGISGKNALVCGASKGLGRACAEALAHARLSMAPAVHRLKRRRSENTEVAAVMNELLWGSMKR